MPTTCLHYPHRFAAALLLLLGAACAEESTDPIGPDEAGEPALAAKGPKAQPTSDGRIFFAGSLNNNYDVFSILPDGGSLRRLTSGIEDEKDPAVSPDGKKVAYLKKAPTGPGYDLWIMNADGTRPRMRLAVPDYTTEIYTPVWTPDGRGITFWYYELGTQKPRIATIGVNSGAPVIHPVEGIAPSWSPDGQYLAYANVVNGGVQLFTSRPDGSDLQQWTDQVGCCGLPRWSPDGHQILFFITQNGTTSMYVAHFTKGGVGQLVTPPSMARAAWSPDGAKIVYADATGDLYVALASGYGSTLLVDGALPSMGMSWSR